MHRNAHNPHNSEVKRALAYLIYMEDIQEHSDVVEKIGCDKSYLSKLVNGKEKPSGAFTEKFERFYLKKYKLTLAHFNKTVEVTDMLEQPATEGEHIIARVVIIEAMLQVLFDLHALQHGKDEGERKSIRLDIDARIRAEVASIRALKIRK